MENSLEKTLKEILEIENKRQEELVSEHVVSSAGSKRFMSFFKMATPLSILLLIIAAALLSFSFYAAFTKLNTGSNLVGDTKSFQDTTERTGGSGEPVGADVTVVFGSYDDDSMILYFKYDLKNKGTIVFTSSKPGFDEVVDRNMGLYLKIVPDRKLYPMDKYTLVGFLVNHFPRMNFVFAAKAKKHILLSEEWVDWSAAASRNGAVIIPLNPDYKKFRRLVLRSETLRLPQTHVMVQ